MEAALQLAHDQPVQLDVRPAFVHPFRGDVGVDQVVGQPAFVVHAFRLPGWTGDTAPIFIGVSREIYDPSINTDESWLFFSCSADGPKDINVDDWFLRLELILFNEGGQAIYVSEADDSTLAGTTIRSAGGICAFDGIDTWLEDDLIDHGYIEFPRELEPASALVYVDPDETSQVQILTDTYTAVHRPVSP